MAEAKLTMIDKRIQRFKLLLQAIKESQIDLDEIYSSVKRLTIDVSYTVGMNQEIADSYERTFDLGSFNESIETTESDILKTQQRITLQDETLKKIASEGIKLQKDSSSAPESQETPMNEWQRSKVESHGATKLGNSKDKLNSSISQSDSNYSDSESDRSLDNISADLINHIPAKQLSANNSSPVDLETIQFSCKCSVFSLRETKSVAKKRKRELRSKLTAISQASPKDNEVLASELPKRKRRANTIPQLKYLSSKPDTVPIETRCSTKEPLTMKVICKARNKKSETRIFCLKMSKNDTFVDAEKLHKQLKSCIQCVGKNSKSRFVKCHCNMCLSGKPVIGRSNNLLSHLYRNENIVLHCCYCDKSKQNMKRMRNHIQRYHWSSGEIL